VFFVFGIDVKLNKTTRLGRKIDRPLLVCLDDASVRDVILYQTGKLRKFEQHKNVYISPDRTKFKRQKHQKLVQELKRRRESGEQNLVICNNSIVTQSQHSRLTGAASGQSQKHS